MEDAFDNDGRQSASPDDDRERELTEELKAELGRRLDRIDSHPNDVVIWEDIERHVRRKRSG